ncbi:unnamed protein product [Durusdinium trenchii]|uniref:Uncharacterized protein n=2 Tax=Durusdinium trenchii TaxID=1381693 RepID=A0ABP0LGQ0_9DINO
MFRLAGGLRWFEGFIVFHFVSCAGALVEETSSGTLVSWKIQIGGFAAPPSPASAAWDRADAASSRGSAPPRRADAMRPGGLVLSILLALLVAHRTFVPGAAPSTPTQRTSTQLTRPPHGASTTARAEGGGPERPPGNRNGSRSPRWCHSLPGFLCGCWDFDLHLPSG